MIVVDASAVTDLLLQDDGELELRRLLADRSPVLAPHLIDIEVLSALRRVDAEGADRSRIAGAVEALPQLPIVRFPHTGLAPRIWQLRTHIRPYDAAYVALAEDLQAELLTTDERLARSHGHHARITLYRG